LFYFWTIILFLYFNLKLRLMKKRTFVTIFMVVFTIMLSSNLFSQIENSSLISSKDTAPIASDEGLRGISSGDVNGVYVPD